MNEVKILRRLQGNLNLRDDPLRINGNLSSISGIGELFSLFPVDTVKHVQSFNVSITLVLVYER